MGEMIPSYSKEEHLKADSPPTEAGDRPSPQHIMVFGRWVLPLNGKGVSGSGDSSGGVASGISKGSGGIVNPKQSQKPSTPPTHSCARNRRYDVDHGSRFAAKRHVA